METGQLGSFLHPRVRMALGGGIWPAQPQYGEAGTSPFQWMWFIRASIAARFVFGSRCTSVSAREKGGGGLCAALGAARTSRTSLAAKAVLQGQGEGSCPSTRDGNRVNGAISFTSL